MHSCTSCGKSFKFQSSLSRHRDIHKPEFKVRCSCGSSFTRSDSLKRHQLKCAMSNAHLETSDDEDLNVHSNIEPEACKALVPSNKAEPIANMKSKSDTQTENVAISKPQSHPSVSKIDALDIKHFCDNNDLASDCESPIIRPKRSSKKRKSHSRRSKRDDDDDSTSSISRLPRRKIKKRKGSKL